MTSPSHSAVLAWARLVRAYTAARETVDRALKESGFPSLEFYDVLLELERQGPLRPRHLQKELLLPQYDVSRLLARMEVAGLVERLACRSDKRGHFVAATTAGKRLRRKMWTVYGSAIHQAVGSRLTSAQAEEMSSLLQRIASCEID